MSLRIINLGSGSKGNATAISTGARTLLIDCGFSLRQIMLRLNAAGIDPYTVCGILLTHEHTDHMRGAARANRELRAPLLATAGTLKGTRLADRDHVLTPLGLTRDFHDFRITAIGVPHDTSDPCAFKIEAAGRTTLVATDIGDPQQLDLDLMGGIHHLLIEANHDQEMLRNGPYRAFLKRRIAGPTGHLSNRQCAWLLREIASRSPDLRTVVLAHLSDTNNDADLALETVQTLTEPSDTGWTWQVGRQDAPTELVPLPEES